jgi:cytochrome c biogenesis protein CcdA/peroxiredoxin
VENPSLYLALIAGLISFISPCVLPLVPAYVGYMGGRMTTSAARQTASGNSQMSGEVVNQRFIMATHSLFFIAGFTLVFVSIGLLSTAFISVVGGQNINTLTNLIGRIGGVVIVFFGLHFMGVLPRWLPRIRNNEALIGDPLLSVGFALSGAALILWSFSGNVLIWQSTLWQFAMWAPVLGLVVLAGFILWLIMSGAFTNPVHFWQTTIDRIVNLLYADTRRDMQTAGAGGRGFGGSAAMGMVFSAGWTPCIGPVYGAVLTMAASGGDVAQAGTLLTAYSLGLGVPFLLTALALDRAQAVLRRLQRHMRKIEVVSGTFLIIIGLSVASGQLQNLSATLATGQFAEAAINFEERVIDAIRGGDADAAADTTGGDEVSNDDPAREAAGTTDDTADRVVGLSQGNLAPDFATRTDTGQPVRLSDFHGQVVVLNFWATWCGPCRIEMPEFEAVFNEYQDRGLQIVAVNNAETVDAVQGFREELGLTFTIAMDERADIQDQYNIFSYPSTYILDRDGTILVRWFGIMTAAQIHDLVSDALGG